LILWGFTYEECKPYIEYRSREVLFRESVLSFLSGGKSTSLAPGSKGGAIGHYCKGKDVEECSAYFRDDLANICSSCPQ
jgi:hypothetical protein